MDKKTMHKKSMWFDEELDNDLINYSEKTKLSQSDIVRVATREYLRAHPLEIVDDCEIMR